MILLSFCLGEKKEKAGRRDHRGGCTFAPNIAGREKKKLRLEKKKKGSPITLSVSRAAGEKKGEGGRLGERMIVGDPTYY